MDHGVNRVRTGFDYEPSRKRRGPRRLQLALALTAVSAFGSAWLLRDGASASVEPATATEAVVEAAGSALAAPAPADAAGIAPPAADGSLLMASTAGGLALPPILPTSPAADEAGAVQPPVAAETPDEAVVDSITEQIEEKPAKKKLSLPVGLKLKSSVVLVVDQTTHEVLAAQNAEDVQPIASLTKLMTALVVTDAKLPLDETIEITREDIDTEKHTYSRLAPGLKFTRKELLLLALMSSENRAASALGRAYPGGRPAFIHAMNARAESLGMLHTHYVDSNGLSSHNVSTAQDLVHLIEAAYKVPLIREFSTQVEHTVKPGRRAMHFVSSNRLVRARNDWRIGLQKTGFTNEAGRCLVMQATVKGRPLIMVLLDSDGKLTRFADAQRVRHWIEAGSRSKTTASSAKSSRARVSSTS